MIIRNAGITLHSYQNIEVSGKAASIESTQKNNSSFADALQSVDSGKIDHIEISGHQEYGDTLQEITGMIRENIKETITSDTAPERLEDLKGSIESGAYPFSSKDMAQILLFTAPNSKEDP